MSEQEAVRRLVKSGPELWAQCSDPLMLSKHLAAFGEIKITRLDPENTVAWEGESARGTVSLEPAGWGTKVRLTAAAPASQAPSTAEPVDAPAPMGVPQLVIEPEPVSEPEPTRRATVRAATEPRGIGALISSLFNRRKGAAVPPVVSPLATELEPEPTPAIDPEPTAVTAVEAAPAVAAEVAPVTPTVTGPVDLVAELEAALDSLGAAHHRPYSRS